MFRKKLQAFSFVLCGLFEIMLFGGLVAAVGLLWVFVLLKLGIALWHLIF